MSFSVVILSKNAANLTACVAAIKRNEDFRCRMILVDDGVENGPTLEPYGFSVPGQKPFCFPRNANIGIRAAGEDDVVLLNDDALLETPFGFTALQRAVLEYPEYGLISATTNIAGNASQWPMGVGLRDEPRTVAFVCVLIPRRTIETVGLMDERFGGVTPDGRQIYGFCDNDMCRRVRNAGLKIGIHDGCFVDHGSLRSEFRGDPHAAKDISVAGELYTQKWGDWA